MFAIPIVGLRNTELRPPLWLRIASLSGFLMTLLYVTLSIFPIIDVQRPLIFTAKIAGMIVAANLFGVLIFVIARSKRDLESVSR
jgi:hypothetical protein